MALIGTRDINLGPSSKAVPPRKPKLRRISHNWLGMEFELWRCERPLGKEVFVGIGITPDRAYQEAHPAELPPIPWRK